MSAPTIVNGDISDLVTTLRDILAHGTVTKLTGHQIERLLAIVCQCTTADLSALTDMAGNDASDGRPA